jgi:hypothetical protein
LQIIFTCRENLQRRANGFDFSLKEGELQIFIAVKNSSPLPGFNPRNLCPVASTLTITPPRTTKMPLLILEEFSF